MGRSLKRGIGNARQNAPEIGGLLPFLKKTPKRSVSSGYKEQNGDDGTHRD
jgi:hypothetical protein